MENCCEHPSILSFVSSAYCTTKKKYKTKQGREYTEFAGRKINPTLFLATVKIQPYYAGCTYVLCLKREQRSDGELIIFVQCWHYYEDIARCCLSGRDNDNGAAKCPQYVSIIKPTNGIFFPACTGLTCQDI